MAEITAGLVKDLREKTGAGMMDCKNALVESGGDMENAVEILRKKGIARASKKADRAVNEGRIEAYIHPGSKLGVIVEINCETDFVANTDDFKNFAHDVAMQIAASSPLYVRREDVAGDLIDHEMDIYKEQARSQGKPEKTITTLVTETIAKLGENITIRRFTRFKVGE
jgi:elongation factor Ts